MGHFNPEVGGVGSTVDGESLFGEGFGKDLGIFEVKGGLVLDLLLPLRGKGPLGPPLSDVGGAVEEGGHDPVPIFFELRLLVWNHAPGEPDPRKASHLGEGVELNGTLASPVDFKNRARRKIADKMAVGGVVDEGGADFFDPGDELGELLFRAHRSSRVVGGAEEDDVDFRSQG